MKKLITLLFVFLLVTTLAVSAAAAEVLPYLVDEADLLTPAQEAELEEKLADLSEKWDMDIVVVTADDLDGASSTAYADDFFDYGGYGKDGILWLIDMDNRQSTFSTTGKGIDRLDSDGEDLIQDEVTPLLTEGSYYDACLTFVELCGEVCAFNWVFTGIICLVIGLVVALIATGVMKGQLKSVRAKAAASDYMKSGSLQVTESRDLFLYRNVTRTARPKDTGSGGSRTSSSGRSHGGGGGKF